MQDSVLVANKLSKVFGEGHTEVRAVDNVNFSLNSGDLVLVMGPSGSGKTTFLSMLGGLLRPSSGSVILEGNKLSSLNEKELSKIRAVNIGFIFQSFNLLDALTVEENILLPAKLGNQRLSESKKRAEWLMTRLGIIHRRHALPKTLSGGEKQRVAIARALINQPKLVLADEPTGNLDSQAGQEVMMILHDIVRDTRVSVIVVTHDPRLEDIADRILWLEDGKIRDRKNEKHAWSKDPVCRMLVDEWKTEFRSKFEEQTYVFCSKKCKLRFDENPDQYLK